VKTKVASILYVAGNRMMAEAVKNTLEREGFRLDLYADGNSALESLQDGKRYDLLIFDGEVTGTNVIEVVRCVRSLPLCRRTPILMFSAANVAAEAYRAGVSLFLRQPQEALQLTDNIKRLLSN
jgi:CheY-like chemotaxis protein